jgi:hypothetical protein
MIKIILKASKSSDMIRVRFRLVLWQGLGLWLKLLLGLEVWLLLELVLGLGLFLTLCQGYNKV